MLEEEVKENQSNTNLYSIPIAFRSSHKIIMQIGFIFFSLLFFCFCLIPFDGIMGVIWEISFILCGIFFLYTWLDVSVMKNNILSLTADKITLQTRLKTYELKWFDIAEVCPYILKGNSIIGINSKEKASQQPTLYERLFKSPFSLSISLSNFSTVDSNKLLNTILYQMENHADRTINNNTASFDSKSDHNFNSNLDNNLYYNLDGNHDDNLDNNVTYNNAEKASPVIQFFKALMITLISGILYGACLEQFKIYFTFIPIIATGLIVFTYFGKSYHKKPGIFTRLLMGILSALQFYIAIVTDFYMLNASHAKPSILLRMFRWLINNMATHPEKYIRFYVYSLICFIFVAFYDIRSSKKNKNLKSQF